MISVYVMCIMVIDCTVLNGEMCYGISVSSVCNVDGVYGTVQRNLLWYEYM